MTRDGTAKSFRGLYDMIKSRIPCAKIFLGKITFDEFKAFNLQLSTGADIFVYSNIKDTDVSIPIFEYFRDADANDKKILCYARLGLEKDCTIDLLLLDKIILEWFKYNRADFHLWIAAEHTESWDNEITWTHNDGHTTESKEPLIGKENNATA